MERYVKNTHGHFNTQDMARTSGCPGAVRQNSGLFSGGWPLAILARSCLHVVTKKVVVACVCGTCIFSYVPSSPLEQNSWLSVDTNFANQELKGLLTQKRMRGGKQLHTMNIVDHTSWFLCKLNFRLNPPRKFAVILSRKNSVHWYVNGTSMALVHRRLFLFQMDLGPEYACARACVCVCACKRKIERKE
jgi:hypothetical protein